MTRPSRLALWLLERLLPRSERDAFIGDLTELAETRSGRGSWWVWRQTIGALLRVRAVRPPIRSPAPGSGMRALSQDLRSALRQLRRAPTHSLVVLVTLALGIGATTAVFSVANPVLFRPLPFPEPDRLAMIWEVEPDDETSNLGYATFADLVRDSRHLESLAAMAYWTPVIQSADGSERLEGQSVTAGFFGTLGVAPALGRDFTVDEDRPRRNRVVILADGLWRRRFGADPTVIGRQIDVSGTPYTVVGVLPPRFESVLAPDAELWRPLGYEPSLPWACRTCGHLRVVARVRGGVPEQALSTELNALMARYASEYPTEYAATGFRAVRLDEHVTARVRPALLLALGAGLAVLLIAGANVTNLLLARAVERGAEFGVRAALGASRGTLLRQLLVENWLLALAGAAAGVAVAAVGIRLLLAGSDAALPRIALVRIDWVVLLVALALTVPMAVLVGLAPAAVANRRRFDGLRARGATASRGRRRVTGGLVVAQIALAVMLLAGAGLLLRSLRQVLAVEPGFDPDRLLTLEVIATGPRYAENAAVWRVQADLLARVREVPGVRGVGLASQIPLGGNFDAYGVQIEDKPLANPDEAPGADRYAVSPGYLSTMAIPVLRGRGFAEADGGDAPPVALINRTFARLAWPGEDPIGKRIKMGSSGWRTIVGIVGDVRHVALDARQSSQFYVPLTQWPWAENNIAMAVRTSADPGVLASAVRAAVLDVDPSLAIANVATGTDLVATATAQRRLLMRLFQAFALTALLLAGAGIYGLLSRMVAERNREIGIRLALGAGRRGILRLVLGRGALLAGAGTILGLAAAVAAASGLRSLLYEVAPADPVTLTAVAAVLAAVAVVTCLLPALRAARVDPVETMRLE